MWRWRVRFPHRLRHLKSPKLKRWFRQDWKSKPNGKAVVLKTTSNHVKVMCEFESHFFLYDTDTKKRRLGDKP